MTTNPIVSVILPNYNHSKFLKERIESILGQTFQNFELIILDDFSQDSSREVIEQYRGNSHITCIIYNSRNSGSTFSQWKKGIGLSKGQLIWIAESDDFADTRFLEKLEAECRKNPDAGIVFCQSRIIDQNSKITSALYNYGDPVLQTRAQKEFKTTGKEEIRTVFLYRNGIPNASAAIFKKSVLENSLTPDLTEFKYCGDWYLYTRVLAESSLKFIPEPLNYFRTHSGNMRNKKGEFIYERIKIIHFISSVKLASDGEIKEAYLNAIGLFINTLSSKTFNAKQIRLILKYTIKINPVLLVSLVVYFVQRFSAKIVKLPFKH